jgi:gliding motility-associated-like protein
VLPVSKSKLDTLLCEGDSLTVGDKTICETGNYEINLKNTLGCDSTVNVKLRMIKRDYHLPDTTLCNGKILTIGNQKITESGIYNIPLKNINACDSIIHIKVNFIPPDIVVRDTSVCSDESLIINGEQINETGSYYFPLINKYGCDSTVTYNVKFNSSDEIKIDTSICEGNIIKVGDQSFTQSGKYLINLQNRFGCDSIIELYLKMLTASRKELDTILCPDQSIKIGNNEISVSGNYQFTLQNSAGCDSIIDITVKRTELDTSSSILSDIGCASGAIEVTAESNAPPLQYLWSDGSTELSNTGLLKGKYELRITDHAGCKYVLQFDVPERKPYYIPEVFTPDDQNEEINRTFRIFTTDPEDIEPRVKVHSIKIFNRWGATVYSSENNSFWDGTFRKSPAPAGVYLYSIAIESPCGTENVKGQVLLLR